MNITKYKHACLVIEKGGQRIVVDPGVFSDDFVLPENVVAIVVTHEHHDHFDPEKLRAIAAASPDVVVYAHEAVLAHVEGLKVQAVKADDTVQVGNFTLRFRGGEHALIHKSIPRIANLGVIVDDALYYPGDSFVPPKAIVHTLAVPANAPWMRVAEAMDFLAAVKPMRVFPTHDVFLSEEGHELADRLLGEVAKTIGAHYERLPLGTGVEL